MRNGNLLKSRVSEIRVKRIRVNQGVGVFQMCKVRNEARTFQHVHLHNGPLIQQNHEFRFDEFFSLFYYAVL